MTLRPISVFNIKCHQPIVSPVLLGWVLFTWEGIAFLNTCQKLHLSLRLPLTIYTHKPNRISIPGEHFWQNSSLWGSSSTELSLHDCKVIKKTTWSEKQTPNPVSFQIFMYSFVEAGQEPWRTGYIMQEHLEVSRNKRNREKHTTMTPNIHKNSNFH